MTVWKKLQIAGILILTGIVAGALTLGGGYWYFTRDLPQIDSLNDYNPSIITTVYSRDGRVIGEFAVERRQVVDYEAIPPHVVQAFLAMEDQSFFEHSGINAKRVLGAAWENIKARRIVEGASTITMQVARTFFLTREKKFSRKIREALLAMRMEQAMTKEEILYLYLNQIYLGEGAYGVAEAARTYYDKPLHDLTLAEAALISGLPTAPSRNTPFKNPDIADLRKNLALDAMADMHYITRAEADAAKQEEIVFKKYELPNTRVTPYFTEHIRRYLLDTYGEEALYRDGLTIVTTVDIDKTQLAQAVVQEGLHALDARQGFRGPKQCLTTKQQRAAFMEEDTFATASPPAIDAIVDALVLKTPTAKRTRYQIMLPGKEKAVLDPDSLELTEVLARTSPRFTHCERKPSPHLKVGDVIETRILKRPQKGPVVAGLTQIPVSQAALLSVTPRTGEVLAMVGGYDFARTQFNRAVQAQRQPGSGFKPIVYTAAIDYGFTPASPIMDTPITYENQLTEEEQKKIESGEVDEDELKWYRPKNYGGTFSGSLTLAHGLALSKNLVTIKLFQRMGAEYARAYAYKMGVKTPLAGDSTLALGSTGIPMTELVTAYGTIATGGMRVEPVFVNKVFGRDGALIEDNLPQSLGAGGLSLTRTTRDEYLAIIQDPVQRALLTLTEERGKRVLSEQTAYVVTNLMEGVIERGTGARAKVLNRPLAGKTGTTDENRDAWFTGFSTRVLTSVWVGNDNAGESLGAGETGSKAALPIWIAYMQEALADDPVEEFIPPEGVVFYEFDDYTGALPGPESRRVVKHAFKEGTEPTARLTNSSLDDLLEDNIFQ